MAWLASDVIFPLALPALNAPAFGAETSFKVIVAGGVLLGCSYF